MRSGQTESAASEGMFERARDQAIEALRAGYREAAGLSLWHALQGLDTVHDEQLRRSLASRLGNMCWELGFDDLALFALDIAVELGEAAGDVVALENDRITLGNVHSRLGNLAEAETAWQVVHEAAVLNGDDANAAAAATNLGGLLAQEGYLAEAAALLECSLEYLQREPFPETELNTRFVLLQVLHAQGAQSERVLDVAESLSGWADQVAEPHTARLAEVVERALADRPERRSEFNWLLARI
jgi:tetratricopeptide (TPR) repeat protein